MFTTNDMRHIAIQIERNGEKTYRSASLRTNDAQLAEMLNWLADEELKHLRWFESLELTPVAAKNQEIETMGQALLQEMMKNQTFSMDEEQLTASGEMAELLVQSLAFEQDTVLFYEMLRSFMEDTPTLNALDTVIAEEKRHIEHLKKRVAVEKTIAKA